MSARNVTAHFEGSAVEDGVVPFDDLIAVFGHLQSAVRRMAEELAGRTPRPGRLPDSIRSSGSLVLAGTRRGSWVAEIGLADPKAGTLPDFGGAALDKVVSTMERPEELPPLVAREIAAIADSLREGIDAVHFVGGTSDWNATVRRSGRGRLQRRPPERESRTLYGRLLEVDWKDHTAELHTATGVVRMAFDVRFSQELKRFATQQVAVSGSAELGEERDVKVLEVETIEGTVGDDSFWERTDPEDLIRQANVAPFAFGDPRELDPLEDVEDVEVFLDSIFGSG